MKAYSLLLLTFTLAAPPAPAPGPTDLAAEQLKSDEALLKEGKLPSDGPGLMDFFRKQTLKEADTARIKGLIAKLADEEFAVREASMQALMEIGPVAAGLLRQAEKSDDAEVRRRVEVCLKSMERATTPLYQAAAARVLGHRAPEGMAIVLLDFLPHSGNDEGVRDAVAEGLAQAAKKAKPDPVLLAALEDKDPAKRTVAAVALASVADHRDAVRKLLKDSDPNVRQRVALALFDARDDQSVPVLVKLLSEGPVERIGYVEEALADLAGEKAPAFAAGTDAKAREKAQAGWEAWYKDVGAKLDLAKADLGRRSTGAMVLSMLDVRGVTGKVVEMDATGKTKWEIGGLRNPVDVQMLPGDKVLIAEYTNKLVTERNLKGEILWQYTAPTFLLNADRLPGGNTLVVTRTKILEVDKDGKEVLGIPLTQVAAGCRNRDGTTSAVTTAGQYYLYDAKGKQVKNFKVGNVYTTGSNIEMLPNGRVLVPEYSANQVAEYDADGKQVWKASIQYPTSVQRLRNGHTLVASRQTMTITELDRTGKVVKTFQPPDGRVLRAVRR